MPSSSVSGQDASVAQYDLSQAHVDGSGVRDMFWPIQFAEVVAVRDHFTDALVARYRAAVRNLTRADEELLMLGVWLILLEALTVFKAEALRTRCSEAGRRPEFPAGWETIRALVHGEAIRPSHPLRLLRRAPPSPSRWRLPLRFIRAALVRDGIARYPIGGFDPQNHIGCISVGGLISAHARLVREPVVFLQPSGFFPSLATASLPKIDAAMIDGVVGDLDAALDMVGLRLSAGSVTYMRGFLAELLGLLRLHLDNALRRPSVVPLRLWTGVGNTIWPRILRYAVRINGGKVTGHDHGMGGGHKEFRFKSLIEFESCDTFVTFTAGQVKALTALIEPRWLAQPHIPVIDTLPGGAGALASVPKLTKKPVLRQGKTRTVMYVTGISAGQGVGISPRLPDPVAIDWQARVLSTLRQWDYDVALKPHPAAELHPPHAWLKHIGVRVLEESFERVSHTADVAVFEAHQSTAFASAILAGVPIVLIDLNLDPLALRAREAMERRCAIVKAHFDAMGRVQVDWRDLQASIERSRTLNDDSFMRTYLLEAAE